MKQSLKVLVLSAYYEPAYVYGGPARSIPTLCRALANNDVSVTVFTTNSNGDDVFRDIPANHMLVRDNVKVFYFRRLFKGMYFFSPALVLACLKRLKDFDIVHIHGIFTFFSLMGSFLCQLYKKPYVIFTRGMLMPWAYQFKHLKKSAYMFLLERRNLDRAQLIVSTDASEAEAIKRFKFKPPVFNVPNGLDLEKYKKMPLPGKWRQIFGILANSPVILLLGRLHQVKRPELAFRAFAMIAERFTSVHLVFAGPDEEKMIPGIVSMAKEVGIDSRVHFTGLLSPDQVIEVLADADLLLCTSESENFGMAIVEAMAAGLPVVVPARIGLARVVRDSNAGLVWDLTATDIADCLASLLEKSPKALKDIGNRGRKYVFDNYEMNGTAKKFLDEYIKLAAKSG